MSDYDELLARAEEAFDVYEQGYEPDPVWLFHLAEDLYAALRAALAAQPQPLFEGTPVELRRWLRGQYASTEVNTTTSLVVHEGSATPEEREPIAWTQDHNGEWHEAGSATPTGDDDG